VEGLRVKRQRGKGAPKKRRSAAGAFNAFPSYSILTDFYVYRIKEITQEETGTGKTSCVSLELRGVWDDTHLRNWHLLPIERGKGQSCPYLPAEKAIPDISIEGIDGLALVAMQVSSIVWKLYIMYKVLRTTMSGQFNQDSSISSKQFAFKTHLFSKAPMSSERLFKRFAVYPKF
jgi:hypothetical protein